jgi:hypothetical protein
MLRYIVIALCSGMVDQVFWWRLVARGYGLIDDTDSENWRERPAYRMLKYFLSLLGNSTFTGKRRTWSEQKEEGEYFMFEQLDGTRLCLAYSCAEHADVTVPFECESAFDAFGNEITPGVGEVLTLTGRPVYLYMKE